MTDVVDPDKDLFIIRGIPGAGQKQAAELISSHNVSPHDFMKEDDWRLLDVITSANHGSEQKIKCWMGEGLTPLVVHGEFPYLGDLHQYFRLARLNGYEVHIMTMEGWKQVPDSHFKSPTRERKTAVKWQIIDPHLRNQFSVTSR